MTLRSVRLKDVPVFDYAFNATARGLMQDVGRTLGSSQIGLVIQTVRPGQRSSRRHKHVFQEEMLIVMSGQGTLLHGDDRLAVCAGDCFCYRPDDDEAHTFENTGTADLVIWAFGNRFVHEVCLYPDDDVAFVEGLGVEIRLSQISPSAWTEERRKR